VVAQGVTVAADADRNVVVAGYFQGAMMLGGKSLTSNTGSVDLFLAKLDGAGKLLWSAAFGDVGTQDQLSLNGYGLSVAADASGNVVFAGALTGVVDFGGGPLTSAGLDDVFVAKFAPDGKHLWSKRFGDAFGQGARGVAIDSSGAVVIVGELEGTADFGGGPLTSKGDAVNPDASFVVKLDAAGEHVWSHRYDASVPVGMALSADGSVLITGGYIGTLPPNFGGGKLLGSAGDIQSFVVKLNSSGDHVWSEGYGGANHQVTFNIAVDSSGNPVVTGSFQGTIHFGESALLLTSAGAGDIFAAKLAGSNGDGIWAKQFGDAADQTGYDVSVDAAGNVLLTGKFAQTVDFGCGPLVAAGMLGNDDAFVAKLNPAGGCISAKRFGDAGMQKSVGVAVDGCGDVLVTGAFAGSIDFGQGALTAMIQEAFVAKLSL
jgi:hypothetical protein